MKMTAQNHHCGVRTIAPEENFPPVRVRVWASVRISFRVKGGGEGGGGNFTREQFS